MNALFKTLGLCLTLAFSFLLAAGAAKAADEICCRFKSADKWLPKAECEQMQGAVVADSYCPQPSGSGPACCRLGTTSNYWYQWVSQTTECYSYPVGGTIVADSYCQKLVCCGLKGFPNVPYKWLPAAECTGNTGMVVANNYCLKPTPKTSKTIKNGAVIKRRKAIRRCCLERGKRPYLALAGRCKGRYVPISHCRR